MLLDDGVQLDEGVATFHQAAFQGLRQRQSLAQKVLAEEKETVCLGTPRAQFVGRRPADHLRSQVLHP